MRKILAYLLLILLVNVSFLFSPKQKQKGPNALCPHQYIDLNRFMRFPINCDSYVFVGASINPSYLLQKKFVRQSRPLYILTGTVFGYTIYYSLYPFRSLLGPYLKKKFSKEYSEREMKRAFIYGCFYAGYIFINIIILILSFLLFEKITSYFAPLKIDSTVFITLLFLLVSNQICKDYFWAPHQQMFNIFSPLLCMYVAIKLFNHRFLFQNICWITFGAGFMVLLYGNFLLLLPTILYFYYQSIHINRSKFLQILSLILLFFGPTLLWILILKLSGTNFYSYETDVFRQFVWISDSFQSGLNSFLIQFGKNIWAFIQTSGGLLPVIILIVFALVFKRGNRLTTDDKSGKIRRAQATIRFVFLLFALFLLMLGYYADRLTFSLLPILLSFFIFYTKKIHFKRSVKIFIIVLVSTWHIYLMLFNAPHFSDYYFYR